MTHRSLRTLKHDHGDLTLEGTHVVSTPVEQTRVNVSHEAVLVRADWHAGELQVELPHHWSDLTKEQLWHELHAVPEMEAFLTLSGKS